MKSVTVLSSRKKKKKNSVYTANSLKKKSFCFWKIMKVSIKEINLSIYMNIYLKYILI